MKHVCDFYKVREDGC